MTSSATGRSDQRSEGGLTDLELARVVAAWSTLPEQIRRAVLVLVGTAPSHQLPNSHGS